MKIEQLIKLVRQHPALYDYSNSKNSCSLQRRKCWNEIAKQLQTSPSLCKAKWVNIRDTYRKSMKNRIQHKNKNLYKYIGLLDFVPLQEEKALENRFPIKKNKIEDNRQDETNPLNAISECCQIYQSTINNQMQSSVTSSMNNKTHNNDNKISNSKEQKIDLESASSILLEYIIKKENERGSAATCAHPVDIFLQSIAPPLKSLHPYFLNLAKSEIFRIVQKYEMKMLMQGFATADMGEMRDINFSDEHEDSSNDNPIDDISNINFELKKF